MNYLVKIANEIKNLDLKDPQYNFKLQAKIKRFIHAEKSDMYEKFVDWLEHYPTSFVKEIAKEKAEQHEDMSKNFTDEQLITWEVKEDR